MFASFLLCSLELNTKLKTNFKIFKCVAVQDPLFKQLWFLLWLQTKRWENPQSRFNFVCIWLKMKTHFINWMKELFSNILHLDLSTRAITRVLHFFCNIAPWIYLHIFQYWIFFSIVYLIIFKICGWVMLVSAEKLSSVYCHTSSFGMRQPSP